MPPCTSQVDADGIADRHRRSLMEAALADYLSTHSPSQTLQEADWSKVRGLEFREALEKRDQLRKELEFVAVEDEDFEESVGRFQISSTRSRANPLRFQYQILHIERTLEDKIAGCGFLFASSIRLRQLTCSRFSDSEWL